MRFLRQALGVSVLCFAGSAETLTIEHDGVGCVVADRFPTISARLDPPGEVARARVYFRATGTLHWYFVEMRPEGGGFSGVLPKPKRTLNAIDYYIEAVDLSSATSRTADTRPEVVAPPGPCPGGLPMAVAVSTAKVVVGAAGSAPAIPLGFASEGIVGAAGAAGTAAGGGISTTAVVVGVVAAGAAVAGVAVASGGGRDGRGVTTTTTLALAPATTTPGPPATTPPASLTGTWVGLNPDGMVVDVATPSCVRALDLTLNLVQSGSSLTGTARIVVRELTPGRTSCNGGVGLSAPGSLSGTVVSNTVTFVCTIDGGNSFPPTFNFTGTFTASRMSGTFVTPPDPPPPGTGTWSVNRQ